MKIELSEQKKCPFCKKNLNAQHGDFVKIYDVAERRLHNNSKFFITPTLGNLTADHSLVCTNKHFTSFFPDMIDEGIAYIKKAQDLGTLSNNCLFFEHGINDKARQACGINHAHIHSLGVDHALVISFLETHTHRIGAELKSLTHNECLDELHKHPEYLFVTTDFKTYKVVIGEIPSQFMRQVVANLLNKEWDWRKYSAHSIVYSKLKNVAN